MTTALSNPRITVELIEAVRCWMEDPNPDTAMVMKFWISRMNSELDETAPGEHFIDDPMVTCHAETVALLEWCKETFGGREIEDS